MKLLNVSGGDPAFGEVRQAVLDSRSHGGFNGDGLLVDLFDHKVQITALFGAVLIPVSRMQLFFNHFSVQTAKMHRTVLEYGNLPILQQVIILGILNNSRNIRGNKHLSSALTHNQRAFTADGIDGIGSICKNDTERK